MHEGWKLSFVFIILSFFGFNQTTVTETITSGTSWSVPCGVTEITVEVVGGGGGGGMGGGGCAGGGGGSGGYSAVTVTVINGQTFNYTVGAGGAGATSNPGTGATGSPSTFTDGALLNITANGGTGGTVGGGGGSCSGGNGGTGGTAAGGTTNTPGNPGLAGETVGTDIGGKGGSTPNFSGVGGLGGAVGIDGAAALVPGGGGGGGGSKSGSYTPKGGAGASGAIIITYVTTVTQPDAGYDQAICGVMTMTANIPGAGWTGTWADLDGNANIVSPNNPTSAVGIPVGGTCSRLTWTFSMAGCADIVDTVLLCRPLRCNDEPCGATPLTVGAGACTYTQYFNNNATTTTGMVEPGCGNYDGMDVWFSATVPANGILTVQAIDDPAGGSLYPGIALYTGPDCFNLTHEGCDNSTSTSSTSPAEITYIGEPGETVYIRYWNYFEYSGAFQMCAYSPTTPSGDILPGVMNSVPCGSTLSFYDPGGDGGNYQPNSGGTYYICPDTPGQYVTLDFTTGFFDVETGYDKLTILDGGPGSDMVIGQWDGTNSPGTITSSQPDGCLTVLWQADYVIQDLGWDASVTCSALAGVNDTICSPTNCTGGCGQWICADGLYPTTNDGNGIEDLAINLSGCFTSAGEIASKWFYFTVDNGGTVEFSFDGPQGQDYNLAIWGPSTNGIPPCPMSTGDAPIRCSQAAVGNTGNPVGLNRALGGGEFYEGSEGDGWLDALDVKDGETYAMILNIYMNGNPQPDIDLTIGGSADLDCTPVFLSATIQDFAGVSLGEQNKLSWISTSQTNNDYFTIEKSMDGKNWEFVGSVDGAGNSQIARYYSLIDEKPYGQITYYRLSQVDFEANQNYHGEIVSIANEKPNDGDFITNVYPNPSAGDVTFIYTGTKKATVVLEIRDELGKIVMVQEIDNVFPNITKKLNLEGLATGMYQLTFKEGERTSTKKLSIIR